MSVSKGNWSGFDEEPVLLTAHVSSKSSSPLSSGDFTLIFKYIYLLIRVEIDGGAVVARGPNITLVINNSVWHYTCITESFPVGTDVRSVGRFKKTSTAAKCHYYIYVKWKRKRWTDCWWKSVQLDRLMKAHIHWLSILYVRHVLLQVSTGGGLLSIKAGFKNHCPWFLKSHLGNVTSDRLDVASCTVMNDPLQFLPACQVDTAESGCNGKWTK